MKRKFVDAYMDTAVRFAMLSTAKRLQVGSVIVKDNRIQSIGYNGMPAGWTNVCENEEGKTKDEVVHAEANAIIKLARDGESGLGSTIFITHAPCIHCAKMIYGAGISKVYYKYTYRDTFGLEFLEKCGIEVEVL
jgi:dCMP deaminase